MFDAMSRLIEIAVLTSEYEDEIKEIAVSAGREEMCCDLRNLEDAFEQASHFFKRAGEKARMLYDTL